ncbi:hypothetical protein [Streptomyces bambusae]|uniref:ATP-grasp domain-containing protein n=1 Tax=Streptomyces bambusae TaxID=1550616 RepID=A0ABS6ZA78_9ACTN|nr:hypothetical protein [Streptomyces bambusae]MBW5484680.1 hypothetical protein [Streptomyces bambusae]
MTVAVLHDPRLGELPYGPADGPADGLAYADWLADRAEDLVLVTGTGAPAATARTAADARMRVHRVDRYALTAAVETTVLDLAAGTPLTALVALHPADQVRAGALRDRLGLPGLTRDQALLLTDPLRARDLLAAAGVPVTRRAAARRIIDLYLAAHDWGYPLVVRDRRAPGSPVVAELADEAALRAFADGGISVGAVGSAAGLTVEPRTTGERRRTAGDQAADTERTAGDPAADAALAVLPAVPGHPVLVETVRVGHGTWAVDLARYAPETAPLRELVRAQAQSTPTTTPTTTGLALAGQRGAMR